MACAALAVAAGAAPMSSPVHIAIVEMTTTTNCQHGGDPLQIQITLFDRQRASHVHHGGKLIIRQAKHVPDDNPEKAKLD